MPLYLTQTWAEIKQQAIFQQINYGLFLIFILVLPYHLLMSSYVLALLFLNWLIEGNFKAKYRRMKVNWVIWLFIGFYGLNLLSFFLANDKVEAGFDLEKKLNYFVIPLLLSTCRVFSHSQIKTILFTYVFTFVVAVVGCLMLAFQDYSLHQDQRVFYYLYLARFTDIHSVALAAYMLMSGAFTLYLGLSIKGLVYKILLIFLIIFQVLFIVLLASKIVLFILFLVLGITGLIWAKIKRQLWLGLGMIVLISLAIMVLFIHLPFVKERFIKVVQSDWAIVNKEKLTNRERFQLNELTLRLWFWKLALKTLHKQKAWFMGVSNGDSRAILNDQYKKANFYTGTTQNDNGGYLNYNTHNQYLETLLRLGLLGLGYLIIYLAVSWYFALKNQNYLHLLFLFMQTLMFMTDTFLEINKGIVFFMFFNSIFIFHPSNEQKTEKKSDFSI